MTGLDPKKLTHALIENELEEARRKHKVWIESELANAKRESDALFKRAEGGGLAMLDETKKKCEAIIEETAQKIAALKAPSHRKRATFMSVTAMLVIAAFVFGYLLGKG
jgi:hypothetical protein